MRWVFSYQEPAAPNAKDETLDKGVNRAGNRSDVLVSNLNKLFMSPDCRAMTRQGTLYICWVHLGRVVMLGGGKWTRMWSCIWELTATVKTGLDSGVFSNIPSNINGFSSSVGKTEGVILLKMPLHVHRIPLFRQYSF